MRGIFAVYKPKGPTSFNVIRRIKKLTGQKRVGHAGTLDPLASGVLVVGVGREATRQLNKYVQKEKEYIAKIKLGETSETDDEEGFKIVLKIKKRPTAGQIKKTIKNFIGEISQIPPIYSALKINGRAAYKYARAGEVPNLKPRLVEIKEIEILDNAWPFLTLRVITGPGVYIRSLAKDIGQELKTGGYLADLERVRVGQFDKTGAVKIY